MKNVIATVRSKPGMIESILLAISGAFLIFTQFHFVGTFMLGWAVYDFLFMTVEIRHSKDED